MHVHGVGTTRSSMGRKDFSPDTLKLLSQDACLTMKFWCQFSPTKDAVREARKIGIFLIRWEPPCAAGTVTAYAGSLWELRIQLIVAEPGEKFSARRTCENDLRWRSPNQHNVGAHSRPGSSFRFCISPQTPMVFARMKSTASRSPKRSLKASMKFPNLILKNSFTQVGSLKLGCGFDAVPAFENE